MVKDKIVLDLVSPLDLYGPDNQYINLIKSHFLNLKIIPRGTEIFLEGKQVQVDEFKQSMDLILAYLHQNQSISKNDIERLMEKDLKFDRLSDNIVFFGKNGIKIKPKNINQNKLVELSFKKELLFVLGPAGTGKTYISIALAVKALKEKKIKKIILTRPAVEAGENLGFLPGDLYDKLSPYMQPLYDSLNDMLSKEKLNYYMTNNYIEIVPLAFMRGRTLDKAFVILDEAQNTTINQMKMFLTRMGASSRFIVCGDTSQIDLPKNQESGLIHASRVLQSINSIGFINFDEKDIIRHELVQSIIKAYKK
ncbi:MAG: phosphate starvation-inducible protein PhoH [Flavobacteriales bacterium]|nr:phosphate starvation-inducible protein PhoH [Flavobacteriales bacterium]